MRKNYIPLTAAERSTIENHLELVEKVVKRHISINNNINGMGYDDLIQEGSIGLCVAARTYNGSVLFETYASKVIRNHLIDHCRSVLSSNKHMLLADDQQSIDIIDLPAAADLDNRMVDIDMRRLFSEIKCRYKGSVLRGIEALELKAGGYNGKEIAALYGVEPNLVGAWISKAKKELSKDIRFMQQFTYQNKVESLSS